MTMKESMMSLVSARTQMNKLILIIPLFFITMCGEAPVTPPAGALEVEGGVEKWYAIVDYLQNYQREENKTQPSDAINNALDSFWEQEHGSNGSTKSEELLQLSSN